MPTAIDSLDELEERARSRLESCSSLEELDEFHVEFLGRNGAISDVFDRMSEVPDDQKAAVGQRANQLKQELTAEYERRLDELRQDSPGTRPEDRLDVTLPARSPSPGSVHPIHLTLNKISTIFQRMGFSVVEGPEIETDWYNFEALNIPEDHPARDMHDTFYLEDDRLLRTHTSPVQVRTMEDEDPPLRIIVPGRVYRRDQDVTHSPMFHQVEGLWVDESVTFDQLKGTLEVFVHRMFGPGTDLRFRPSYFPFTEPSAEIDIRFGDGDSGDWLEILGAGMVDPEVFEAVGYDPDRYQGFAFGMGVERISMIDYGVENLQRFFDNDLRFLRQFSTAEF